jgi:hypothetical protein
MTPVEPVEPVEPDGSEEPVGPGRSADRVDPEHPVGPMAPEASVGRFSYAREFVRPEATRISDGVVMRLPHVYEVDPELMGDHFDQQTMPKWDTLRIVSSRNAHLDWMHAHFAHETLVAGEEPELDMGPGTPVDSGPVDEGPETPAKHPRAIFPTRRP